MNRKLIDEHLGLHGSPSVAEMDDSRERTFQHLRSKAAARNSSVQMEAAEHAMTSRPRIGLRFAVAATLIMTVAIGVYAFRAQRESTPKAVLPAAQSSAPSGNGAAEVPQVAAVTPGAAKPGAALSRAEILAAQIAAAQATDAGAVRAKFAVASVRPVPISPLINNGLICLGVDGLWGVPGRGSQARGRCVGDVVSLTELVFRAYSSYSGMSPTGDFAITGMPRNLEGSYFQINAVADNPERVTKDELRLMVRALLEDRFKVRVHFETKELDGYVLTIGKSGIKFKETSNDPICNAPAPAGAPAPGNGPGSRGPGGPAPGAGPGPLTGPGGGKLNLRGKCTRMEAVTGVLSRQALDRLPVADKTGLTGTYYDIDFILEFAEGLSPAVPAPRGLGAGGAPPPRQFVTPVPKALEDQLGLHLERG
jgi:uncharacterized protein (TIGR03435 family)